jgi:hypothetical protein
MPGRLQALLPFDEVIVGARFLGSLPGFLRNPTSLDRARAILAQRLERREPDFLALMQHAIFRQPKNPYYQLLRLAGCEYGDLERLVGAEGVEGALRLLHRSGVYLTVDELKGRREAVRGSARLVVDPARLRNPGSSVHLTQQTSGSRGRRSPVPVDLAVFRQRAVNRCLMIDARGGGDWLHAAWYVPGGDAVSFQLVYSRFGSPPARWFSPLDPAEPRLHPRYRWSDRALRWGARLAGIRLPRPRYVPLDDPLPIARWLAAVLAGGRTPHLLTYASPAVRLCQAALGAGLDLKGAQFSLVGEPVTSARLECLRRVGVTGLSNYSSVEAGPLGDGCLGPEAPDDVHLYHDLVALIQPEHQPQNGHIPSGGLFVSSIRPETPVVLLNASLGDQAVMTWRNCGCPMERVGWTTHLHTIRSFEKLTAGGMTFLDSDVINVLEVTLPARFGGGPTDYQLLEAERADGRPELRLLVHPRLGPLDSAAVTETFLETIGEGDGAERIMALQWRQAGLPRVERRPPLVTGSGKILHLHQTRQKTEAVAAGRAI